MGSNGHSASRDSKLLTCLPLTPTCPGRSPFCSVVCRSDLHFLVAAAAAVMTSCQCLTTDWLEIRTQGGRSLWGSQTRPTGRPALIYVTFAVLHCSNQRSASFAFQRLQS
ncbi:hypothetical protein LY78DRAFT_654423 [Colletotrichum sublineola]|nr:hypothetical protein LY78DRAFT_654423 [Colletotrichum sublineola]